MAKCNQLTSLPLKGLKAYNKSICVQYSVDTCKQNQLQKLEQTRLFMKIICTVWKLVIMTLWPVSITTCTSSLEWQQWIQASSLCRSVTYTVAARGCLPLPPGANVCVAAPGNQISSAIRVFFSISDIDGVNQLLGSPSLSSPLISSPSLFSPFPSSHSPPFPSLKSRPLKCI